MTAQQIESLKASSKMRVQLQREKIRGVSSLQEYARRIIPNYYPFHHSRIICSELQKFYSGETPRLVLTVGPQYGKSLHSSALLPSYILGRNPNARILLLSYGASLAGDFNREVQKIMDSEEYLRLFPASALGSENVRTQVDRPRRNSDVIDIPGHSGMFVNAGIGGGYTGKGFNYIILDDLIKSRIEADSATYRQATIDAYTDTIRTRRANDKTGILILNTRWHPEDLTGALLKRQSEDPHADKWRIVNLPALLSDCVDIEAERWKFPPGQERGKEVLWPEHFSFEDVLSTKSNGAFNFAAQYMGTPFAREGNIIKRAWYEPFQLTLDSTLTPQNSCIYYDIGGSAEPTADRTVGTVEHRYVRDGDKDARTMLLWQQSGQWNAGDREAQMESFCLRWNKIIPSIPIYLENTFGLAKDVAPAIRNRLLSKNLNVYLDTVRTRKFGRAEPFLAASEAKRIELYSGTLFEEHGFKNPQEEWIFPFLDEATRLQQKQTPNGPEFTGGKDDRIDSPVGGFNMLNAPKKIDYFALN